MFNDDSWLDDCVSGPAGPAPLGGKACESAELAVSALCLRMRALEVPRVVEVGATSGADAPSRAPMLAAAVIAALIADSSELAVHDEGGMGLR